MVQNTINRDFTGIVTKSSNISEKAQKNLLSLFLLGGTNLDSPYLTEILKSVKFIDKNLIIIQQTIDKLLCQVNNDVEKLIQALYSEFAEDNKLKDIITDLIYIADSFKNLSEKDLKTVVQENKLKIEQYIADCERKELASYDANGNLKATTSNAMISYVKSMAIGSRYRAINVDNIYYGYEGTVDPSLTLNSTTVSETGNLKATINYGDSITSNLWLGIYNDGEECGSGMGTANPMHRINLSGEKTVSLPRLSAGNYYAVIMRDTSPKGSKVYFTVTDVAKSADIYADDVEANIGGTVKVPVVLGNNPGLKNLVVNVKWDPSVLTPVKATNGIVMGNAVFKATKTTYSYELSWNGTANTTATGTIAYIEFKVNSNANLGDNDVMVTVNSATSGSSDITDQFITDSGFVKVKDTALKIDGTTLSISSDITIKYLVKKDIFDAVGFSNPYLEATLGGKTITLNPITSSVGGVACYLFSFNNVAPQMMNDTIFTTLKATKDGVVYSSKTNQYSVATYIYSKLASATDPSFKTLLVDMLNYGASAQIYNGYNVDKLVSANLTTAQKKFGTSDLRALTNVKKAPTVASGDKATWLAMGLYLDNKVAIKGYFDTDLSNVYVKVTDTSDNLLGTVKQDAFSTVTGPAGTPVYAFVFDGLGASQMSKTVKLTVCDSTGKAISGTFEYSIESYVYSSQSGTDAKLVDITEKIIKYGDAAVNYLNTQTSTFNKLTPADVGTNFFAHIGNLNLRQRLFINSIWKFN